MPKLNTNLKRTISLAIGTPATIVMSSEVEQSNWYVPFIGMAIVTTILFWNREALKAGWNNNE